MSTAFLSILLAALCALASASFNPCHDDKWRNGQGVTCNQIKLPGKLCSACKLKPALPNGNFVDCKSIYDLDDPLCKRQLAAYARLNADCDPVRVRQLADFDNLVNKRGLDYFVYSICEECCDCIPPGVERNSYRQRKRAGTLLDLHRGNCPAHAVYDICKVWPEVAHVGVGKRAAPGPTRPVCPLLDEWRSGSNSTGWPQRAFVPMHPDIKTFLGGFMKAARCGKKSIWDNCWVLENSQGRV